MSGNEALVSVCCLGYNHGKFITDNIEAIWNSDYKDVEIIVVDDGSKDNSGEILKDLQAKSPLPMKVILQENTGNIGYNFNVALRQAKGQYITFIALDDVLKSDTIRKVMEILKADDKLAFVASSVIQGIDDNGKKCKGVPPLKLNSVSHPTVNDLLELEYAEFGGFYIQGTFFRKEVIDVVGGFDEDMTGDDIILRTKVLKYMEQNPRWTFKILAETLCYYRQHDTNIHYNSLRQVRIVAEYLERYWQKRENPRNFVGWVHNTLRQMPKNRWIELFGINKRTLSCLAEPDILDLLTKPENQEKIVLKIPLIITVKRIKNYIKKEKQIVISILGKEFRYTKKK